MPLTRIVAYFSMEIGLRASVPTYSGGLGVLAGDTIRSAADLGVPVVGVTLLHRQGYFRQELDRRGRQQEQPDAWPIEEHLAELEPRVSVTIDSRTVHIRAWRHLERGVDGHEVPVLFLDTYLRENDPADREIASQLYGDGETLRLGQEIVLGIGGVRMLEALGYHNVSHYHMNEGHSSLLTFELLQRELALSKRSTITEADFEAVRGKCLFTTHTPVPAGHDQFPLELAQQYIGDHPAWQRKDVVCYDGVLNMTYLALKLSRYVNGVAQRHGEVSRRMFSGYEVDAITNGVHAATWTSAPFRKLFDRYLPAWRTDNYSLRYVLSIADDEIWAAHLEAKQMLLDRVKQLTDRTLDLQTLTIGFARRATPYKRSDLLFSDIARLRRIVRDRGPLQLLFAGKAHPRDEGGKQMIRRIHEAAAALGDEIPVIYLPNYNMDLGELMTAGVDVWLNTPQPPMEASGTSGMKAALNGVPSLSVLDGWWIEGCIDGVTGWSIGPDTRRLDSHDSSIEDREATYQRLADDVMPTYYDHRETFLTIMRHAIAINGAFFNTQRMVEQYARKAYRLHG